MKLLLIVTVLALVGCLTISSQLTAQEEETVVSLARRAVIDSGVLGAEEAQKVNSSRPVLSYYFLSRPLADYRLSWKLSGAEEVVVSGRGDILHLEKATIKRQRTSGQSATPGLLPLQLPRPHPAWLIPERLPKIYATA
ncbi:MAG: hypothetical protein HZA31_06735 [Opitutae bacterium]|nr:hypothetical protein [Opitutae bacterium]